jgi:hypothetical protein
VRHECIKGDPDALVHLDWDHCNLAVW